MGIFPTRILLGTDGSEEADLATRNAVELADSTNSELHMVHVGQVPNFLVNESGMPRFGRKLYKDSSRRPKKCSGTREPPTLSTHLPRGGLLRSPLACLG